MQAVDDKAKAASQIMGEGGGSLTARLKKGPKVVMHHSRDTAQKQWAETRVLTMQGLGRLHRAFLRSLRSRPWYPRLWTRTLETARAAVLQGSANAEVALGGISLLFLLLQLASKAGLTHGPLRAAVGMKVVDGALQASAEASKGDKEKKDGRDSESAVETSKVSKQYGRYY